MPPAFETPFVGPEGRYLIRFRPIDEWDGVIDVAIAGRQMRWDVVNCEVDAEGGSVLGGTTSGSEPLWGDAFWFELHLDEQPPIIRYWENQIMWREDRAA